MRKKICIVTGTRADYGILNPVMKAVSNSRRLQLIIVATGMHMMPEFGKTVKEIENDGFRVDDKISVFSQNDSVAAMAELQGRTLFGLAGSFKKLKPDLVLVLGDRGEMLMAAIAANYLGIPVAHLHGGEVSGHIDGQIRHAITKLSHLHFAATWRAQERIIRLGEDPRRVFLVGAPALDRIMGEKLPSKKEMSEKYSIRIDKPLALVAQHPVLTENNQAAQQMEQTLKAIKQNDLQSIIIYPNADAGGRRMIKIIKKYVDDKQFKAYRNVPHRDYLALLSVARVLVGNSSSGIIEAPSFKLPVVNIGSRQEGRERSKNVIDVPPRREAIRQAIKKALNDRQYLSAVRKCRNVYGDGRASVRIVKVLNEIKIGKELVEKKITC